MTDQPGPADWPPGEGVPPEPPNVGDAAGATVEQPGAGQVVAGPAADEVQLAGEQERLAPLEWPDNRRPAPANPPKRRVTLRRAGSRSVALPGTQRQRLALGGAAIGVGVLAAVVAIGVARPSVGGEATAARQSFAPGSAPASVAVGVSAQPSLAASASVLLPSAGSGGVAIGSPQPSSAVSLGTCDGLGAPDTWVGSGQGATAAVDLPA